jgi:hypothetical protein
MPNRSTAALMGVLVTTFTTCAAAEPVFDGRAVSAQTAQGGVLARGASGARGEHGAIGRDRGIVSDGNGNTAGGYAGGFTTEGGAQGQRRTRFKRNADGSASATSQASASGSNGSADRNASYTRNADGTASGERTTTITNNGTGVTLDGTTTYTKGSGAAREVTCRDASGNAVACGPSR